MDETELRIAYESHDGVQTLIDQLQYSLEAISLSFDRWGEQYVKGPGMYIAVVTGPSIAAFADPMGRNQWPTDRCRSVEHDCETFVEAAQDVALTRDGAVVFGVDGVVETQMVRFTGGMPNDLDSGETAAPTYEDWMGSRHMSALDISQRSNVVATLTLSEETGRVTRFEAGSFETATRTELGGEWNPQAVAEQYESTRE
ncbi:diadenylate cyclase [Natronorubrum bangense]|uniref:DAC domain-containing protein n=2 Tax=Natronorubrum bangense TaxID=61858 RepID=L9WJY5_9EURY|nr:diadenylate cyclase [Natronorubrum bangense]ELY49805.1 hypothetical protein C494_07330 [Natronorubrum bangense JCM 10635]QCC55430.1 hypothetical protein DV706_13715 [Natronorubrum bangense]